MITNKGAIPFPSAVKDNEESSTKLTLHSKEEAALDKMRTILAKRVEECSQSSLLDKVSDFQAYAEAKKKSPGLIEKESDPVLFLRRENLDPEAACRRLFRHWAFRRKLLGPDLAFQPLLLAPKALIQGALSKESEWLSLLPEDKQGRTVILAKGRPRRKETEESRLTDLQCWFILGIQAALNAKSQTEGLVLITYFSEKSELRSPLHNSVVNLLVECMPLNIHSHFVAAVPPPGGKGLYREELLPAVDRTFTDAFPDVPKTFIVKSSPLDIGNELSSFGFIEGCLSPFVGGKELVSCYALCPDGNRPFDVSIEHEYCQDNQDSMISTLKRPPHALKQYEHSSIGSGMASFYECMEGIIAGYLKHCDKKKGAEEAYVEAIRLSPALITEESDPALFLKRENGDIEKACRRLLRYWKYRRELLGKKRAYLSLRRWEAMGREFRLTIERELLSILPRDNHDRSVLCVDLHRRATQDDINDFHKALHLLYTVLLTSENPKSASDGIVFLVILASNSSLELPHFRNLTSVIEDAMPVKMHRRIICSSPPIGAKDVFMEFMIPSVDRATGKGILSDAVIEVEESIPELLVRLEKHGLSRDKLPVSIGGMFEHEYYVKLIDREIEAYALDPSALQSGSDRPPRKRQKRQAQFSNPPGALKKPPEDSQEKQSLKKPANPKNELSIAELNLPPCGIPLVDQYHGPFSEETVRKLGAAMKVNPTEIFDRGTSEEDKVNFNRKRNAVYSKRKYYRKKLKIEGLMSSKEALSVQNTSLKKENARLVSLWERAREEVVAYETHKLLSIQRDPLSLSYGSLATRRVPEFNNDDADPQMSRTLDEFRLFQSERGLPSLHRRHHDLQTEALSFLGRGTVPAILDSGYLGPLCLRQGVNGSLLQRGPSSALSSQMLASGLERSQHTRSLTLPLFHDALPFSFPPTAQGPSLAHVPQRPSQAELLERLLRGDNLRQGIHTRTAAEELLLQSFFQRTANHGFPQT